MPESSPAGPRYVRPPGLTGPWISQETRSLCFCGVFLLTENIPVDLFGSDPKPIMVLLCRLVSGETLVTAIAPGAGSVTRVSRRPLFFAYGVAPIVPFGCAGVATSRISTILVSWT